MPKPKVGDIVGDYQFKGGDPNNPTSWAPRPTGKSEILPSFARGLMATGQMPATALYNVTTAPFREVARFTRTPAPPALTGVEGAEALGLQAPTTTAGRVAELTGASAVPAGAGVGIAARAGRALPTAITELASLGGAAAGQEYTGLPGMLAGSFAPGAAGGAIRQLSGPAPRFGSRATQQGILGAFERQDVPATVGDVSDQAWIQQAAGAIPGGFGVARQTRTAQAAKMGERAEQIAGKADEIAGGMRVKSGIEKFVAREQAKAGQLWDKFDELVPSETPVNLFNTKTMLDSLIGKSEMSRIIANPKVKQLDKLLDEGSGQAPYEAVKDFRSTIGRMLEGGELMPDISRRDLKRIYGALTQDLRDIAKARGGEEAIKAFARASNFTRSLHKRTDKILGVLAKKVTPEEAFQAVQRSMQKAPTRARTLAKSLTPRERETVLSAMLQDIGEPPPSVLSPDYAFSPQTYLTNLNKIDPVSFQRMAKGTRFERMAGDLEDLKVIAGRIREVDKVLANPSGTAARQTAIAALGGSLWALMAGRMDVAAPLVGAVGGSWGISKLMTNPSFVRWVAEGAKIPSTRMASHAARLNSALAEESAEIRGLGDAFSQQMLKELQF